MCMEKFHQNPLFLSNFYKVLPKYFVSVEKNVKNCAWWKVFQPNFYKALPKHICFGKYFNMHMEKFYQNTLFWQKKLARTVLDQKCFSQIFIKFYQNTHVSVNILICALKNSTKTLCFCQIFIKFYQNTYISVNILIWAWKNSTETLCFGRKKWQELCLIKSVSVKFL